LGYRAAYLGRGRSRRGIAGVVGGGVDAGARREELLDDVTRLNVPVPVAFRHDRKLSGGQREAMAVGVGEDLDGDASLQGCWVSTLFWGRPFPFGGLMFR
jgi:hypothetical protein